MLSFASTVVSDRWSYSRTYYGIIILIGFRHETGQSRPKLLIFFVKIFFRTTSIAGDVVIAWFPGQELNACTSDLTPRVRPDRNNRIIFRIVLADGRFESRRLKSFVELSATRTRNTHARRVICWPLLRCRRSVDTMSCRRPLFVEDQK